MSGNNIARIEYIELCLDVELEEDSEEDEVKDDEYNESEYKFRNNYFN